MTLSFKAVHIVSLSLLNDAAHAIRLAAIHTNFYRIVYVSERENSHRFFYDVFTTKKNKIK